MATNNVINLNKPVPAFQYSSLDDQEDITGDGSVYKILLPTIDYENDTSFSPITSTFTAPATALYMAYVGLTMQQDDALADLIRYYIVADGLTYELIRLNWTNVKPSNDFVLSGNTVLMPMTVGSTAILYAVAYNAAKSCYMTGTDNGMPFAPSLSIVRVTGL